MPNKNSLSFFKRKVKRIPIWLITISIIALVASAYAVHELTIPQSGKVVTPATLVVSPDTILWGDVLQGKTYTKQCDITNTGEMPAVLNMTYEVAYIGTLTWDFEGQTIEAGSTVTVSFTLTTSESAPLGDFSFDAYINIVE